MKKLLTIVLIMFSIVSISQAQTKNPKLTKNQEHMKRYIDNDIYVNRTMLDEYLPYRYRNVYRIGKNTYIYRANKAFFEIMIYNSTWHERTGISKMKIDEAYYVRQRRDAISILAHDWVKKYKVKSKIVIPHWLYK